MLVSGKFIDENNNIVEVKVWSVYLLFKNNSIIYIGCSSKIEQRLKQHRNQHKRDFDSYAIVHWSHDKFNAIDTERMLIKFTNFYTQFDLENKSLFTTWGNNIKKY